MEPKFVGATLHCVVDEQEDQSDWAQLLAGDGEAFGRLFDRHRSRVYRHCVRLTSTTSDADDVVAVTFFEAWRRRSRVRLVDGSILPWLLVTATNTARNFTRKSNRYRILLAELPPEETAHDPFTDVEGSPVEEALARLSLGDQRVITLCVLEGLSEKDAAAVLSVPPGTVKSRLSRAKARLAAAFRSTNQSLAMEAPK